MAYINRIEISPAVMLGKPVIKGTRITVELILRQLAQGLAPQDVLANYPHLKKQDIQAAIEYAAQLVGEEAVYPLRQKREHGKTQASV
ncbi:MAG: DUF433 domain-containing protein [Candidatus Wildermuthbacteria bacterium]|nr:DUF433 domain-containing protein [Candidatus Wildermuthbacteria bacterium]